MNNRDSVLAFASQQLGKPYRWGATGPDGYDCSGLVYAAYKAAGLNLPRETAASYGHEGVAVSEADAQPGDVVYFAEGGAPNGHVGLYLGGGKMVDAPTTGKNVEVDDIHKFGTPVTSIRRLPQIGDGGVTGVGWLDTLGSYVAPGYALANSKAPPGGAIPAEVASLNPFSGTGWQASALSIGLKVAAVAVCGGLLIVGAKQTVNPGA